MNKIGRKIYYDVQTGNILIDTGEKQGFVIETTLEEDIKTFKILSERHKETFDYIKLPFGAYVQDFAECNGYRVIPDTKKLEFSYPDPNEEEPQEQIYQAPLSEEVAELKAKQDMTEMALLDLIIMGGM